MVVSFVLGIIFLEHNSMVLVIKDFQHFASYEVL